MWPILPDFRWEPGRSHASHSRVEVWSQGLLVESDAPFVSGSVTEKWVTGARASLALTVEPSSEWVEWFALPNLELRPFAGTTWGGSRFEAPLGVFPTYPPAVSLPAESLTVNADDRWQLVTRNELPTLKQGAADVNTALAAFLMQDAGLGAVSVVVTRPVWSPSVMWDKSRNDLIVNYLEPTGSEAFVDRTGVAFIQDRVSQPGIDLTDGIDGTVVKVTSTRDWSKVVNAVTAASSKNDVVLDPVLEQIDDWWHPAHESKIGRRTMRVTSPLITTEQDARAYARAQLEKSSAPALSWSVTCVPDPTRMPGDLITVTTALGVVRATVQEVTHPLGEGEQTLKLGAAL